MVDSFVFNQLGFIVKNLHKSIEYYSNLLKTGPFVLFDYKFENYQYRGRPSETPVIKVAMSFWEGQQIELIQQLNDVPSPYRHYLQNVGEGMQHFAGPWARSADEYQAQRRDLFARGYEEMQSGLVTDLPIHFSYFGKGDEYPLFEIADAGQPVIIPFLVAMRDLSRNWDGKLLTIDSSELRAAVA
jgi:hypothetical protein